MRKVAFLLLLSIVSLAASPSKVITDFPPMDKVFSGSEFKLKEVNISGWVKLSNIYKNMDQIKQTAHDIYKKIMDEGEASTEILQIGEKEIRVKGRYENADIVVEGKAIHNETLRTYENVVSVDITQHQDMLNITVIRESIYKCLGEYGSDPHVNVCITKYIEGNLDPEIRTAILDHGISLLGAEKVEGIQYENLISISGYSRNLPYHIKSGGKNININTACRYSPFDDKTYFWLGTPVINSEY